jgi:hypothetical protein
MLSRLHADHAKVTRTLRKSRTQRHSDVTAASAIESS